MSASSDFTAHLETQRDASFRAHVDLFDDYYYSVEGQEDRDYAAGKLLDYQMDCDYSDSSKACRCGAGPYEAHR